MHIVCPHCRNPIELIEAAAREEILCPSCGSSFRVESTSTTDWSQARGGKVGKFELLEILGQGAFGTVYKARDPELDRTVALKVPRTGQFAEAQELDRFLREARSAAQLQHPSIVPVHEVGTQDGLPYLVSDFVEGVTLADFLTSRQPSFRDSAQLIAQLADALHYAHERGVVHRDVKPSNIMLDAPGAAGAGKGDSGLTPRLMDFGLAKRDAGEITMTMDGQVLGTPAYMSPEQARGEGHRVDGRSDVYSLGAVLYQLLTGEVPFRGNARMLLWQVLHEDPRPPRKLNDRVPRDLETICLKALAKEPSRRYRTAGALADDLRRFLNGEAIQARLVGRLERLGKWARRRPAVAALLGVIVLATVSLLGGGIWFTLQLDEAREKAEDHAKNEARLRKEADQKRQEADRRKAEADKLREAEGKARRDADKQKGLAEERARDLREHVARLAVFTGQAADDAWEARRAERANDLLLEIPGEFRGWEWRYRKRRFQGSYCTLYGHTGKVLSVAFSPDGQRLASADGTVRLWDARTGQPLAALPGHTITGTSVAFSPDGQRLASGSGDGTVKLWEARTGRELFSLGGHMGWVNGVAFSPDGQRLASASEDKMVKLWDGRTGQLLATLAGHTSGVRSVAFSSDGQRLASGGGDLRKPGELKLWDARTGQPLATLNGHTSEVTAVAFSPDGQRLASGSYDRTVRLWDARTGQALATLPGHTNAVSGVAFSPDGQRLASASVDRTVRLWDARTGQPLATLPGHSHFVSSVVFSPDGQRLASASLDRTVKLWDARTGQPFAPLTGHTDFVLAVAYSPDGQRLASASVDKTVRLWDARTSTHLATLSGHTEAVSSVAFSPDGQRLASGSGDKTVRLWDARTGQPLAILSGHTNAVSGVAFSPDGQRLASASVDKTVRLWGARTGTHLLTLTGHSGGVAGVAFSPDGQRLASASSDKTVRLWDARTGQPLATLKGHSEFITSVAYSPDGQRLASAGGIHDKTVRLWDARTGQPLATLAGHTNMVSSVAFSPDGQRLASASIDKTVRLWDARTGQPLATLTGHTITVSSVAFSPDGQRLASGSYDRTVRLWDARTGQLFATFAGHTHFVTGVAFSPDGQRLASASFDKTVRLWDARTGQPLATLTGHTDPVNSVAFSPDGQRLASASSDKTVRLWDAHTGTPLGTLSGHTDMVSSVAFSPDGQRLASASFDKTVRLWDARTGTHLATLTGHTNWVTRVVFSPDGQQLLSRDLSGSARAWDVNTGKPLPAPPRSVAFPDDAAARHPSRPLLALPQWDRIQLIDTRPPDTVELGYREWMARFDAPWHRTQASQQAQAKNWFAAAFHWGQLAQHEPGNSLYREILDFACAKLGSWRPALAVCDRLLASDPTLAPIYFHRARLRAHLLQFHEAAADQLAGLALVARNPFGWPDLAAAAAREGHGYANKGDWPRACRAFADAAMWERQQPLPRLWLGWARLAAGEQAAFRSTCRGLYEDHRTTADVAGTYRVAAELGLDLAAGPSLLRGVGRPAANSALQNMQRDRTIAILMAACIVPDHSLPVGELLVLAHRDAKASRTWGLLEALGAAEYRAGQFAAAIATLQEGVRLHRQGGSNWIKLFLAMACHKSGQRDQARAWLGRATLPKNTWWGERLIFNRLRQEAAQILKMDHEPKP